MGTDELNKQGLSPVVNYRDQAVLIAANIEYHPAIGNKTGTPVHGLYIGVKINLSPF